MSARAQAEPWDAAEAAGAYVAQPPMFPREAVVVMVEDKHVIAELVRIGAAALGAQNIAAMNAVAEMHRGRKLAIARAFVEELEGLTDDTDGT
jgi:hypothetical protein